MLTLPPPPTTSIAWSPVLVEAASYLAGAELPDGRGLLAWVNAGRLRYAVTDSPRSWLADGLVAAGDIGTAIGSGVLAASVFRVGGNVYASAMLDVGTTGYQRIYRLSDPNNPAAAWVVHGTVQTSVLDPNYLIESGMLQAGIPHVDGDLWVYTGGRWGNTLGYRTAFAGLWVSTDAGVTWAEKIYRGFGPLGSFQSHIPATIVVDANTGAFYFLPTGGSSGGEGALYESVDAGATWAQVHYWPNDVGGAPYLTGATRYAGNTYAVVVNRGETVTVNLGTAPTARTLFSTHVVLGTTGGRVVGAAGLVFLFGHSTVQAAAGGWLVDACGFS